MTSHVRRYHQHYGTSGHVWQGRYKSFIVQEDGHLLTVARYIEGNPVRANPVKSCKSWKWSSHLERLERQDCRMISDLPVSLPTDWTRDIDELMTTSEVERLRRSVNRQTPFGADGWVESVCEKLGLEVTLHERGRPRKENEPVPFSVHASWGPRGQVWKWTYGVSRSRPAPHTYRENFAGKICPPSIKGGIHVPLGRLC